MRPLTAGQKKQIKESLRWKWKNKRIKPLTAKQRRWVCTMLSDFYAHQRHATDRNCRDLLKSQLTVGIQLFPNKRLFELQNLKRSDLEKYRGVYYIKWNR